MYLLCITWYTILSPNRPLTVNTIQYMSLIICCSSCGILYLSTLFTNKLYMTDFLNHTGRNNKVAEIIVNTIRLPDNCPWCNINIVALNLVCVYDDICWQHIELSRVAHMIVRHLWLATQLSSLRCWSASYVYSVGVCFMSFQYLLAEGFHRKCALLCNVIGKYLIVKYFNQNVGYVTWQYFVWLM